MVYEVKSVCSKCGELDNYADAARYFKYCPDCGRKVEINAVCWDCNFKGSETEVHKHKCYCKKHKTLFTLKLFSDSYCPACKKEELRKELKKLEQKS